MAYTRRTLEECKTGINDIGLAGVRKGTFLCMMGWIRLDKVGALHIKRFEYSAYLGHFV